MAEKIISEDALGDEMAEQSRRTDIAFNAAFLAIGYWKATKWMTIRPSKEEVAEQAQRDAETLDEWRDDLALADVVTADLLDALVANEKTIRRGWTGSTAEGLIKQTLVAALRGKVKRFGIGGGSLLLCDTCAPEGDGPWGLLEVDHRQPPHLTGTCDGCGVQITPTEIREEEF